MSEIKVFVGLSFWRKLVPCLSLSFCLLAIFCTHVVGVLPVSSYHLSMSFFTWYSFLKDNIIGLPYSSITSSYLMTSQWPYFQIRSHSEVLGGRLAGTSMCEFGWTWWWPRWEKLWLQCRKPEFDPWVRKIPWRREWLPTPVFLSGKFHEQKNFGRLQSVSCKELDLTQWLTLSLIYCPRN